MSHSFFKNFNPFFKENQEHQRIDRDIRISPIGNHIVLPRFIISSQSVNNIRHADETTLIADMKNKLYNGTSAEVSNREREETIKHQLKKDRKSGCQKKQAKYELGRP